LISYAITHEKEQKSKLNKCSAFPSSVLLSSQSLQTLHILWVGDAKTFLSPDARYPSYDTDPPICW